MKILVWILLCLIWGSTWLFIKIGLEEIPPFTFAAFRFTLSLVVVSAIVILFRIPLARTRRDIGFLAFTGFLQFSVNYSLVFWSEQYISSGLAAVLQAMIPIFGMFLAAYYIPAEKITPFKIGALLLGFIGVSLIFFEQLYVNNIWALFGAIGIVVGAFAAAYASILTKAKGENSHPVSLILGQMAIGVVPIVAIALLKEGNPFAHNFSNSTIVSILFLTFFGTIVAFWLYYWLLSKTESTIAMTIALVTPLLAVVFGSLFLGEKLPPQTAWGGVLILSSVALIIFRRRLKTHES